MGHVIRKHATSNTARSGLWEVDVSNGREADLHEHLRNCKKNPGHHQFIPVDKFNAECLPPGCRDNDIVDLVRAYADLTVRVSVKCISEKRPEFDHKSGKPYPFSDIRGSNQSMLGTGWISFVEKYPEDKMCQIDKCKECPSCPTQNAGKIKESQSSFILNVFKRKKYMNSPTPKTCDNKVCRNSSTLKACDCKKCLDSPTPRTQFAHIYIYTATHVVYDHLEAAHATCHLFFDRGRTPKNCNGVVTLNEPSHVFSDVNSDLCQLIYTTHDLDLADKLKNMVDRYAHLMSIINIKYFSPEYKKLGSLSSEEESFYNCVSEEATLLKYIDRVWNKSFPFLVPILNSLPQKQSFSFMEAIFSCKDNLVQKICTDIAAELPQSDVNIHQETINDLSNLGYNLLQLTQSIKLELDGELTKRGKLESGSDSIGEQPHGRLESGSNSIEELGTHDRLESGSNSIGEQTHDILESGSNSIGEQTHDRLESGFDSIEEQTQFVNFKKEKNTNIEANQPISCPLLQSALCAASSLTGIPDYIRGTNVEFDKQEMSLYHFAEELAHILQNSIEQSRNMDFMSEKQMLHPKVGSVADSMQTLIIIVSHPHGCSKQVSVGHRTNQNERSHLLSKLTYTTPTCPGSSGARVCMMKRSHLCQYAHVARSQSDSMQNISSTVFEIPLE